MEKKYTIEELHDNYGIHKSDIRFKDSINNNFVNKINCGMLQINDWNKIKDIATECYNETINDNDGKLADYIPQLANVNPETFSIAIVSVDGQVFTLGDEKHLFCVQS